MAITSIAGFDTNDAFLRTIRFLDPKDLFGLGQVCKSWQKAVVDLRILEDLLKAEKIPEIVGRRPNYKAYVVLKGMFERGVSVQKIEKYYGKPVGEMPLVSQEKYDLMFQPDPEIPGKKMFETYEAVFTPLAIKRTFGKGLAGTVSEQGWLNITLSDGNSTECEQEIPFSFVNLAELSNYPLAGEGHVFKFLSVDVLRQCKSATKVGIYFMRTYNLVDSLRESYSCHEVRAKNINQKITPLIVRAFSFSIKIYETGQCPDAMTCSRTADRVQRHEGSCHAALGGFEHDGGRVRLCFDDETLGFAPGVPAEA